MRFHTCFTLFRQGDFQQTPVLPIILYYSHTVHRTIPSSTPGQPITVWVQVICTCQMPINFMAIPVYGYGGHPYDSPSSLERKMENIDVD